MNENQLDLLVYSNLKDDRKYYLGSYASDELHNKQLSLKKNGENSACFSFISNTLRRNDSNRMGHWLGFIILMTKKKSISNL